MNVVDSLNKNEDDVDPVKVQTGGDSYLKAKYPKLDYVTAASLL